VAVSACVVLRHYWTAHKQDSAFFGAPSFESLPRPLFSQIDGVGQNCTSTFAVDGDGDTWHEHGCEERSSGIYRGYRLRAEQRTQLRSAIDRLRRLPDTPFPMGCKDGIVVRFDLDEPNGISRSWHVCQPAQGEDWPEPFASAQRAMLQ